MEARAINKFIGTSPRKMMLVVDLIRGRKVDEALTILHFSPKHAAKTAEKVLRSAVSNIQNKDEGGRLDLTQLIVKTAFVDAGASMKRVLPAPMGRAFRVRKRSHHLTIVVAKRAEKKKAVKAAPSGEEKKKSVEKSKQQPQQEVKEH
ncbi:MAG: 50S ribosomal protein L22 [bacterium]